MQGSIRMLVGLLVVFGATGGMDNAANDELFALVPLAILGLGLMFSGVKAMEKISK